MGDDFVGTEHLLLGLLVEGEGIGAHVLNDLGANLENVKAEIDVVRKARTIVEEPGRTRFPTRGVSHTATAHRRRAGIASYSSSAPGRQLTTATLYT